MVTDADEIELKEGGVRIRLEHTFEDLRLHTEIGGEPSVVSLPHLGDNFGGHEFVVSEDERYVALFVYSGQSEVGYEVFEVADALQHVAGQRWVYGEGHPPTFSDDSRYVVLAVALNSMVWSEEPAAHGVEWAWLQIRDLYDGSVSEHRIFARVPPDAEEPYDRSCYPRIERFTADELTLDTEWGDMLVLKLPLAPHVVVPGPPE